MIGNNVPLAFGDAVRIESTSETVEAGIAGLEGVVYGFTTPSLTGVVPVGLLAEDYALNVHIEEMKTSFWLDPANLALISRPETMEFSIAGNTIRVTQKDGEYTEEIVAKARPWWKFW